MHKARSSTGDDADRLKDALQKLKSENRKLRKEKEQLRKELLRYQNQALENEDDETKDGLEAVPIDSERNPNCPKCQANAVMKISAGRYVISLCSACGYRKRQENRIQ